MNYLLTNEFTKINQTAGTVQNPSRIRTLEMSSTNEKGSGLLIPPLRMIRFSNETIYLRCVDGEAEVRIVPFLVDTLGGTGQGGSSIGFDTFDDTDVDDIFKP